MLEIGISMEKTVLVDESNTAAAMGSGDALVFATPAMVALMENAAKSLIAPFIESGQSSVGSMINVSHISPSPLGISITAKATLKAIDGKKLTFSVEAWDKSGKIGGGTHERFIVENERFILKANKKFDI